MGGKNTSIRLDPQVMRIVELMGQSYQKIFDRGLVSYALDGKVKDPKIIKAIEERHAKIIAELELEQLVHEQILKFLGNGHEPKEVQKTDGTPEKCRFCHKPLIKGGDPSQPGCNSRGLSCSCIEWMRRYG